MPQTGVGGTVRQTLRGVLAASDQAPSEFRACFYREQVLREYLLGQDLVLYEAERDIVEPAVTAGLYVAKAPRTSSFSRFGTLK